MKDFRELIADVQMAMRIVRRVLMTQGHRSRPETVEVREVAGGVEVTVKIVVER
jgi:hypothetical protein